MSTPEGKVGEIEWSDPKCLQFGWFSGDHTEPIKIESIADFPILRNSFVLSRAGNIYIGIYSNISSIKVELLFENSPANHFKNCIN